MNCTDFRRWIEASVEERQPVERDRAADHLRECRDPECRGAWETTVGLNAAVDAWQTTVPRIYVAAPVAERFAEERQRELSVSKGPASRGASGASKWQFPWAAAAAALVLGITLFAVWSSDRNDADPVAEGSPVTEDPGGPQVAETPVLESPRLEDDGTESVGDSYVNIAHNATATVTDLVMLTFGGDADEIEDPSPGAEWVDDWQERMGPVGSNVGDALDRFFDSLPEPTPAT
ncbi:MAG: hypothetical protein DWQ29_02770 [Planctomycetota bacterium]|nr:MAG: hypothetical protein DWQ29_02770 [Planctomycetota bacterium]